VRFRDTRLALQSFRLCLSPRGRFRRTASSRNQLSVQSSWSVEVSRSFFPRSHSAVGRFLGCVVFLRRIAPGTVKQPGRTLFGFHLPSEFCLTQPSPRAAAGELLSWALFPFSTRRARRSTCYGLFGPATFRPQGLVTLTAAFSRRALAGFLSRRRRSWDSPFGAFSFRKVSAAFPRRRTHMPFVPPVFPSRRNGIGRPSGPRLLGFDPSESPWRPSQD